MVRSVTIDGVKANIVKADFAKGGQGVVHRARHGAGGLPLALKSIPKSDVAWRRTGALIDLKLWRQSPLLAAPFAMRRKGQHIEHLAHFVEAPDLLNAPARNFGEQLERAFLLSCLWSLLEDSGIAHGDIAPGNVLVSSAGEPVLIDFDNAIIPSAGIAASMRGQFMMLAPELRSGGKPGLLSDRFAWPVLFNICLLRRHPADGLTRQPADMDRVMAQGQWPEPLRQPVAGEIPSSVLGDRIPMLFDRTFSLDPDMRPAARDWREAFFQALNELVTHDCGGMLVPSAATAVCPYCGQIITAGSIAAKVDLRITLPTLQRRYAAELYDGQTIALGRHNLGGSNLISRQHLSLTLRGQRLLLRQLGRNASSLVHPGGRNEPFQSRWITLPSKAGEPVRLQIADQLVELSLA